MLIAIRDPRRSLVVARVAVAPSSRATNERRVRDESVVIVGIQRRTHRAFRAVRSSVLNASFDTTPGRGIIGAIRAGDGGDASTSCRN